MCPLLGQRALIVGVAVVVVELGEFVQGRGGDGGSIEGRELRDVGWVRQAYHPRVQDRLENQSRVQLSGIGQ